MVRVIAGRFKHQTLKTLKGLETRPTSDRLKETLFNLVQREVEDCFFLDCFAGSGSVGIEALSRGAQGVVLIESAPQAMQVIQANLRSIPFDLRQRVTLLTKPAQVSIGILQQQRHKFDIVFLDPPYAAVQQYPQTLELIDRCHILARQACVIVEHSKRLALSPQFNGLSRVREVRQGDSCLSLFRLA